jgi:hypothetical protein
MSKEEVMAEENNKEEEEEGEVMIEEIEDGAEEVMEDGRVDKITPEKRMEIAREMGPIVSKGYDTTQLVNPKGETYEMQDGSLVTTASKEFFETMCNVRGWDSYETIRKEAEAYRQIALAEQGIKDPETGEMIIMDRSNPEHVRLFTEQRNATYYALKDTVGGEEGGMSDAEEASPCDTPLLPTDWIIINPAETYPFLITDASRGHTRVGDTTDEIHEWLSGSEDREMSIGPRLPVSPFEWDATLKRWAPDIERILLVDTLVNVPVKTAQLLSLAVGCPSQVITDSFEMLRSYQIMIRIVAKQWPNAASESPSAYFDDSDDYDAYVRAINSDSSWMERALTSGTETKRGKMGKRTHSFHEWFSWLPDWMKGYPINTGRNTEKWFRKKYKKYGGRKLQEDEKEELMACYAWYQYSLKNRWITDQFNKMLSHLESEEGGDGGGTDHVTEMFTDHTGKYSTLGNNPSFLGGLLNIVYWATFEKLRAKETLILRMNAKYIPSGYWECLMTTPEKPTKEEITDKYRIIASVYRKQCDSIRMYAITGDESSFEEMLKEATIEQVLMDEGDEGKLDVMPVSEVDGVSMLSVSRLYALLCWNSSEKQDVENMSKRMSESMSKVDRESGVFAEPYTPDPEKMEILKKQLDDAHVGNCVRPKYLDTPYGKECDEMSAERHNNLMIDRAAILRAREQTHGESGNIKRGTESESDSGTKKKK